MIRRITQLVYLALALVVLPAVQSQAAVDPAAGEKLFKGNCASCHAVNKKLIGPALAGVRDRVPSEDWLVRWVQNSQKLVKAGDEYAVKIYNEYNQQQMQAFEGLSKDDILSIVAYVDAEAKKAPTPTPTPGAVAGAEESVSTSLITKGLFVLIGILVLIAFLLLLVIALLVNAIRAKESGSQVTAGGVGISLKGLLQNKFIMTTVVLAIVIIATSATVKTATGVGLHQGYAPIQPVLFSHKVHAGQYGINCNYCHIGVERGKSATIPATNICANCHTGLQLNGINEDGSPKIIDGINYQQEIAKVREAHTSGTPIEWVRIHNLPDLVYFNHAQHVKVGKVECTTCHGDIANMNVVYQHSDLSMGWCINCHRQTPVQFKENPYYHQVRQDLAGSEKPITVETIGGLECAKCHY